MIRLKCRRCKKTLPKQFADQQKRIETPDGFHYKTIRGELLGYGYGATGLFCSLTCGHWWAVDRIKAGD